MTCSDCARAKVNPLTGRFTNGCDECRARALAQEPAFFESAAADALTPSYRSVLQQIAGSDWKSLHERVKAWAERISAARKGL